jgi:hypothetical protein
MRNIGYSSRVLLPAIVIRVHDVNLERLFSRTESETALQLCVGRYNVYKTRISAY